MALIFAALLQFAAILIFVAGAVLVYANQALPLRELLPVIGGTLLSVLLLFSGAEVIRMLYDIRAAAERSAAASERLAKIPTPPPPP